MGFNGFNWQVYSIISDKQKLPKSKLRTIYNKVGTLMRTITTELNVKRLDISLLRTMNVSMKWCVEYAWLLPLGASVAQ